MPPKKLSNEFIDDEDVSEDEGEYGAKKVTKKVKVEVKEESIGKRGKAGTEPRSPVKNTLSSKVNEPKSPGKIDGIDGGGNPFFGLGTKRRVTVNDLKGRTLIDIREFYEKDGEMLPGKKGISLTVEQYNLFKSKTREIDALVSGKQ